MKLMAVIFLNQFLSVMKMFGFELDKDKRRMEKDIYNEVKTAEKYNESFGFIIVPLLGPGEFCNRLLMRIQKNLLREK